MCFEAYDISNHVSIILKWVEDFYNGIQNATTAPGKSNKLEM